MTEITIPREAIVMICGPSCAGKSTLAEKIFQASSQRSKYLFSEDKEELIAMKKIPALHSYRQRMLAGEFLRTSDFPKDALEQFDCARSAQMTETLSTHRLFIYDGIFLSWKGLAEQLHGMCLHFGGQKPAILIKMLPNCAQHVRFYDERLQRKDNFRLPAVWFYSQRNNFAMNVMPHNFKCNWMLNNAFYEYAITNPCEVSLNVE